ncbi:hypothetical protein [Aeromonas enteropelogenes]|uniref:hypothetical protein n=1 Tax=Aeromonas enteropelogenes TaxID=29489 RepID=UPI003B9E3B48
MTRYYYLYRNDLARGYPRVKHIADEPITLTAEEKKQLCLYQGETLPERLIWDPVKKTCRPPSEQEKHDLDQAAYQPPQSHYVKAGRVLPTPAMPANMLRPSFDIETEQWTETATPGELEAQANRAQKWAYLDELGRYGYARSEHALGLVSDDELAEASAYLMALSAGEEATRPAWFSRYMV